MWVVIRRFLPVIVGLLAFALYASTAYPGVGPTDSGELALAAWVAGVAHPPGFPLYTALGWLWAHALPWGSVAWRLNMFSALAMAAAAGFTAAIGRRWAATTGATTVVASVAGAIAGAVFAVGPIAWSAGVVTEVYALNTLLMAAAVWIAAAYAPHSRALIAAGVLTGAGLAVHPISTLFVVPVLLAWIIPGGASDRVPHAMRRIVTFGAAAALVLLAAYACLLLRAQQQPVLNWGDPSTLGRLWWHMSAAQYRVHLSTAFPRAQELFTEGLHWWGAEFAWVGTIIGIAGWWMLRRVSRALPLALAGVALLTFAYTSAYDIAQDREFYFLPLLLLTACGIAGALARLLAWAKRRDTERPLPNFHRSARFAMLAVAGVMLLFASRMGSTDRSGDTIAEDYARNALSALPPNALVLVADWQLYGPAWYLQEVEGFRRDLILVDLLLWQNRPWYVDGIARRFPDLVALWQPSLDVFREQLAVFERGELRDTAAIASAYRALLSAMFTTDRPVFLDALAASEIIRQQPSLPGVPVPVGLLLEVRRSGAPPIALPAIADWRLDALLASRQRRDPVAAQIREQYTAALRTRAAYLARAGDVSSANDAKALADRIAGIAP